MSAYRPLFDDARARRLVAASLTGRLATGMLALPLLLVAREAAGSFAGAGIAAGLSSAGVALSSPVRGRLVDRVGARRALPPIAAAQAAALAAMALAHDIVLVSALALVVGLTAPPLVAAMRSRWQALLGERDPRLQQAYAFEAAAQVGVFMVGPLVAAGLVATIGARGALGAAAALAFCGSLAFARLADDARRAEGPLLVGGLGPIRERRLRDLVAVTVLSDALFGFQEVAIVAFAHERGRDAVAGGLFAILAGSSVAFGAAYGARTWAAPPRRRLLWLLLAGAALQLPLLAAGSVAALAALLVAAGAPSAAQWATVSVAIDEVAPASTEAYTWFSTANAAGVALGAAVAGPLVAAHGPDAGFLAGAVALLLAAAVLAARGAPRRPLA